MFIHIPISDKTNYIDLNTVVDTDKLWIIVMNEWLAMNFRHILLIVVTHGNYNCLLWKLTIFQMLAIQYDHYWKTVIRQRFSEIVT